MPLIQKTAELKIPVCIHTVPMPLWGDFQLCLVEHIATLWRRVRDAKIVVGHMGFPRWLDLLVIAPLPGIYVETSWGLPEMVSLFGAEWATRFVRKIGVDRVVFGSDWEGTGSKMESQLKLIDGLGLSFDEREKVLGGNVLRALGG